MKQKIIYILIFTIVVPLIIFGWDRYQDQQIRVNVSETTSLYATEADAAYGSLVPIKTIPPGVTLKVKRTTYGKDYWALSVQAPDGTIGWIASGQKGIAIIKQ